MAETLTWGLISTARITRKIIPAIQTSPGCILMAVASRDQDKADDFAGEFGIPRAYGTYQDLLDDPKIDCVYNPLPNSLHAEWTIKALEAGKHVLCEKPFTMDSQEALAVSAAAKDANRVVMEAFMYRFHPQWERVRLMIENGDIGELRLIRAQMGGHMDRLDDIRMKPEYGGGALMDVGCYCVNACRMIAASEPEWMAATANYENDVDVMFTALMRFPGDVLTEFNCGFRSNPHNDVDIIGTEASIRVSSPWGPGPDEDVDLIVNRDNRIEKIPVPAADEYEVQVENFADAVRGESPLRWGAEDAVKQMKVVDTLRLSAERNEPITIEA
jgi:D-xylose 1-dehydrogenase (NADP+, D-xylono-1,5-lactone-forming)